MGVSEVYDSDGYPELSRRKSLWEGSGHKVLALPEGGFPMMSRSLMSMSGKDELRASSIFEVAKRDVNLLDCNVRALTR